MKNSIVNNPKTNFASHPYNIPCNNERKMAPVFIFALHITDLGGSGNGKVKSSLCKNGN
jgi:hypothetical protein